MQEEWRPVIGWEDVYEVSCHGIVRRMAAKGHHKAGSVLTGSKHNHGYRVVRFWRNNKSTACYVHRLVAAAFLGPCPTGWEVNHIDGNKNNNHYSNLEYVTHKQNMAHSYATGLFHKGFKRKLTPIQVREIRASDMSLTCGEVAAMHGVSKNTVSRIRSGKAWLWIQ